MIQNLWDVAKNSSKREVYSNTSLPQETRKISNKQPKLTPKGIRKIEQITKLVEGKKIRAEINEIETAPIF